MAHRELRIVAFGSVIPTQNPNSGSLPCPIMCVRPSGAADEFGCPPSPSTARSAMGAHGPILCMLLREVSVMISIERCRSHSGRRPLRKSVKETSSYHQTACGDDVVMIRCDSRLFETAAYCCGLCSVVEPSLGSSPRANTNQTGLASPPRCLALTMSVNYVLTSPHRFGPIACLVVAAGFAPDS